MNLTRAFPDYETPYGFYRAIYKYTDCGPSVSMKIDGEWVHCESLPRKPWNEVNVQVLSVGSIVEGVDRETQTHEITCYKNNEPRSVEEINTDFFEAFELVNKEALQIWNETHGCDCCAKHFEFVDEKGNELEGYDGMTPVWKDCPFCEGYGVVI